VRKRETESETETERDRETEREKGGVGSIVIGGSNGRCAKFEMLMNGWRGKVPEEEGRVLWRGTSRWFCFCVMIYGDD